MSIAIGSTSRTPYIVWTSKRPERAERREEDLALQGRAEREEEQRDQRRRRDRAQELDRYAKRARGEVARAEEDPDRDRRAPSPRRDRAPSPGPSAGTRSRRRSSASATRARGSWCSSTGRSFSEMTPVRETSSQNASAAPIERTKTAHSVSRRGASRMGARPIRGPAAAAAAASPGVAMGGCIQLSARRTISANMDRGGPRNRPPQFLPPLPSVRSQAARRRLRRRGRGVVRRGDGTRVTGATEVR